MIASDFERSALTLDEILSCDYLPSSSPDLRLAEARIKRWCDICADGDVELFQRRLMRDGLTLDGVRERLAGVDRRPGVPEPAWVAECVEIRRILSTADEALASSASRHAFGQILAPFVAESLETLRRRCPAFETAQVNSTARVDVTAHLWQHLEDLCALPLYRSLVAWRELNAHGAAQDFGAFVLHMRSDGLDALFARSAPLLRLLGLVRRQWLEHYAGFFERLARDSAALHVLSPVLGRAPVLTGVTWGLSDPHFGGLSVLVATFDGASKVVYKPRDFGGDAAADAFLDLLRRCGFTLNLRMPQFIARGGYGWAEFIEARDCSSPAELDDYFRCAGAWLGWLHLLCGSDMHMENLLASAADPVPIDFETLFQGAALQPPSMTASSLAAWQANAFLQRSVLGVGLLPCYIRPDELTTISVGGLEASSQTVRHLTWHAINTMAMRPQIEEEVQTVDSNLPRLAGSVVTLAAHRDALLTGFRTALDFARAHLPELKSFVQATAITSLVVRRIFRPTRFYGLLLRRLTDHRQMTDSVTWSMQTDFIARLFDWDQPQEERWGLIAIERESLLQLCIPAFHVCADGVEVMAGPRRLGALNMASGRQASLERLDTLGDATIDEQADIVATALRISRTARASLPNGTEDIGRPPDLAGVICAHLCDRAFVAGESAAWFGLEHLGHEESAQLVRIGDDLYNGSCGIALFLAAFAKLRGSTSAATMARAAIAGVSAGVRSANRGRLIRGMGPGGGVGVGSVVYGLTCVAELLDDADTLDAASAAASLLGDMAIEADVTFDVMGGTAGAVLALLRLHQSTQQPLLLDRALRCARHLEAGRPAAHGVWSSAAFRQRPLTGVAHGAAGYALAFSRLYAATGESRFRRIARECVSFEDQHHDGRRGNWPDLRPNPETGHRYWPVQWCYGAAGIGYSRIALVHDGCLDADVAAPTIRAAAECTRAANAYSNDTLCCGGAGQSDFLAAAGRHLGDHSLVTAAADRMAAVARQWAQTGDARWNTGSKQHNLGLFRGVAGIGYAALRLDRPELPEVLLWR